MIKNRLLGKRRTSAQGVYALFFVVKMEILMMKRKAKKKVTKFYFLMEKRTLNLNPKNLSRVKDPKIIICLNHRN
jgi:hypothetical protein